MTLAKVCPGCKHSFLEVEIANHYKTCTALRFALDPSYELPNKRIDAAPKSVNVRKMTRAQLQAYRHRIYLERKAKNENTNSL